MYNVNDLGYFNGGVPRKNRGIIRGENGGGPVGDFHSPRIHNYMHYNHPDSYRVDTEEALKFKHYMVTDRDAFDRTRPAHPMYYDTDFNFRKDRDFWLKLLLSMAVFSYAVNRYNLESDRARRTARMDGYRGYPAHWFHNRGGVVVLKDFAGFEKYYQNGDSVLNWYKMAYPKHFKE